MESDKLFPYNLKFIHTFWMVFFKILELVQIGGQKELNSSIQRNLE
jgi:hypothetical protein